MGHTLYEYIERREQLQTPSVRERLLKEFPQVIADAEIELEPTEYSSDDQGEQEGLTFSTCWLLINFGF